MVGHSLGFHIESARLFQDPPGSDIWSGITYAYYEQLPIAELLLRRARMIYAGQVAETFVKTEFRRSFKTVLRGPHRRATPGREAQLSRVHIQT